MGEKHGQFPCFYNFLDIVKIIMKGKEEKVQIVGVKMSYEKEMYVPYYIVHSVDDKFFFKEISESKILGYA